MGSTTPGAPGYSADKDALLKRLRRIEGQVRRLQRMVDEDNYCIDVLTQLAAATKALQSAIACPCARAGHTHAFRNPEGQGVSGLVNGRAP
ncbi:MAG: metal-sensitive transcriptional regulator [Nocardioidaceae bacterium]